MLLAFGVIFLQTQAAVIVVNSGEDLNAIINRAKGGDTVLVKPGTYSKVSLSDKKFSEQKPLVVRADGSENVLVKGDAISNVNVSGGYSDWNNGIMFFGTGVYILNNTINNCANIGIYGNNWKNLNLLNYVYGNTISSCGTNMYLHPEVKVSKSDPGKNPNSPQKWYSNF